ncbi:MAG TPA: lipid-A-disaccharide synthase [Anaerohalosphaeraceae bacterium]|nr:lipid-A-disaccharide synthase [Anaerohalosphaeraceae bacterium]
MGAPQPKQVFISALEPSADAHCAHLIRAVSELTAGPSSDWPGADSRHIPLPEKPAVQWVGLGGPKTAAAGCRVLENPVGRAAMLYNVLGQLGYYRNLLKTAVDYLKSNPIDLLVVCDSPAFHFHLAKAAKRLGIPVLFYVAPQLWAWAPWRIRKLRRCCDRLACILPFEKEWFSRRGVPTDFVGNPLLDDLLFNPDQCYKSYADYDPAAPKIALLPGSRSAEIQTLWPAMQKIIVEASAHHPNLQLFTAASDEDKLAWLKAHQLPNLSIQYQLGEVFSLARRADLALVASGSATLQVAAAGCPMIVMYQSNPLLWHLLGRWLIRTRFLSLVNILARKELVPEYMPYLPRISAMAARTCAMLDNKLLLIQTSTALVELMRPFAARKASAQTAAIVLEMLGLR